MSEFRADRRPLRHTVCGPVMVTGALTALTAVPAASAVPSMVGAGWVLAWLLLGLSAGYGLSGSA